MKYRIPKVIWPKTKNKVLEILKIYNYYALSLIGENQLEFNRDYSIKLKIIENKHLIIGVEEQLKRKLLLEHVVNSYNKLNIIEKEIIYRTYLSEKQVNDDIIANGLGFSVKYYYKIKKQTIIKLAFALGVEVLKGDEDN